MIAFCLPGGNLPVSGGSGARFLQRDRFANERRQAPRQRLEHGVDVGGGDAGTELIDQRIVGREIERLSEQCRLVADQMDDFLEMRSEQFELALLARFEPAGFGARGRLRQARDQSNGSGDRVVALATHLAKIGDLPVDETLAVRLGAIQQARDPRSRQQRVVLGLERRELFAADVCAATRHHDRGIPSEERKRAAEGVKTFELLFELLIR